MDPTKCGGSPAENAPTYVGPSTHAVERGTALKRDIRGNVRLKATVTSAGGRTSIIGETLARFMCPCVHYRTRA